jgi:CheY-like chemotaxis protein
VAQAEPPDAIGAEEEDQRQDPQNEAHGVTASSTPADVERSARAGMRKVLHKPLAFKDLCQALRPFGVA